MCAGAQKIQFDDLAEKSYEGLQLRAQVIIKTRDLPDSRENGRFFLLNYHHALTRLPRTRIYERKGKCNDTLAEITLN